MQLLMRLGVVAAGRSVFDYGCGQGADVEALASQGFDAFGWDPHHAPSGPRKPADVVNLGFVVNVIEDPRERVETLKAAWGFAQRALCVAVMTGRQGVDGGPPPLPRRLRHLARHVPAVLRPAGTAGARPRRDGRGPLSWPRVSSPCSATRTSNRRSCSAGARERGRRGAAATARARAAACRSRVRTRAAATGPRAHYRFVSASRRLLPSLHAVALGLGRLPEIEEIPAEEIAALVLASGRRATRLGTAAGRSDRRRGVPAFGAIPAGKTSWSTWRLPRFRARRKDKTLPRSIQSDIRAFFRTHAAGLEEGRRLLFAAGDRSGGARRRRSRRGLGPRRHTGREVLPFPFLHLPKLPARLRVMVGCAEVLQGGVDASDFVDIDLESPRVTMVVCDDIEQPVPFIVERRAGRPGPSEGQRRSARTAVDADLFQGALPAGRRPAARRTVGIRGDAAGDRALQGRAAGARMGKGSSRLEGGDGRALILSYPTPKIIETERRPMTSHHSAT